MPKIEFILVSLATGVMFNPVRREGLTVQVNEGHIYRLSVIPETQGVEDSNVLWSTRPLEIKVWASVECDEASKQFIESLSEGRYIKIDDHQKAPPLRGNSGSLFADANGLLVAGIRLPYRFYPKPLQTICDSVYEETRRLTKRAVSLLSWQQDLCAPPWAIQWPQRLYWSTGGRDFTSIPNTKNYIERTGLGNIRWSPANEFDFLGLLRQHDATEPLAHELIREAINLNDSSPRSALLTCASALEVGIKDAISKLSPNTAWLLEKTPSPPIHRLYSNYLSRLLPASHATERVAAWLKTTGSFVEKIYLARNTLAHTGESKQLDHLPKDYLNTSKQLLYFLDVIDGNAWAARHISAQTLKTLGWEVDHLPERDGEQYTIEILDD